MPCERSRRTGPADWPEIVRDLFERFPDGHFVAQTTVDAVPTCWVPADKLHDVLHYLKHEITRPYRMLFDLTAVDEPAQTPRCCRRRISRSSIIVVARSQRGAHQGCAARRISVDQEHRGALRQCNWYEREVWDLFGITFEATRACGGSCCRRRGKGTRAQGIFARATEFDPYQLTRCGRIKNRRRCVFSRRMGPASFDRRCRLHVPEPRSQSSVGARRFRIVLQLEANVIVDCVPDIGYHHRGAENMGERQSWHSYIPYTDRVDYLGGVMNNLPYVLALEKLAGIEVPDRVKTVRVMLCEFFRILSHLLYYGTFCQDVGAMSPVFYMFVDRQRLHDVIEAITGFRMHPAWFRIGGLRTICRSAGRKSARVHRLAAETPRRLSQIDPHQRDSGGALTRRRRTRRMMRSTVRIVAPPVGISPRLTSTCAKRVPTPVTTTSTSRCRPARAAMSTIARSCANRRSANRCASSNSA